MAIRALSGWARHRLRAGGSGGGGATPPAVANLIANWKADGITPQADGSALATWTDSVGGIVATQATGANQPTYKVNSLGTKPAVVFAGSAWLPIAAPGAIDTAIASGNYTILIVVDNVAAVANGTVFGASAGANSQLYVANGSYVGRYNNGYSGASAPASAATFTTFGATSQKPYALGSGTGQERIVVRGGIVGGLTTAPPVASSTYAIGSLSATGNGSFNLKGRVYEILFWNRALSPLELLQAEAYLCTKYSQPLPWAGASGFVVFDGDSQTFNVGAAIPTGYPYQVAAALGLAYGQWTNCAVGGITLENMAVKAPELAGIPAFVGIRTVVSAFEYYNSRTDTGAVHYAAASTYVNLVKTYGSNVRVVFGSSMSSTADPDANRTTAVTGYDALLDATPLGDQYVAMHLDTQIGVSGAEAANPSLFFDGVHPNPAGYTIMFPYWTPKVSAAIAMA